MNINEENTMQYLGWKEFNIDMFPSQRTRNGKDMKLFTLNGFIAYQEGYCVVINGGMPIDYAKEMFDNNDNDKLQIRVNGNGANLEPTHKRASNNELKIFMNDLNWQVEGLTEGSKKCELKQSELIESNPDDFYIDTYHIDTVEGLKVFTKMIIDNNIKTSFIK